jgi:hypothetical protein
VVANMLKHELIEAVRGKFKLVAEPLARHEVRAEKAAVGIRHATGPQCTAQGDIQRQSQRGLMHVAVAVLASCRGLRCDDVIRVIVRKTCTTCTEADVSLMLCNRKQTSRPLGHGH